MWDGDLHLPDGIFACVILSLGLSRGRLVCAGIRHLIGATVIKSLPSPSQKQILLQKLLLNKEQLFKKLITNSNLVQQE